MRGIHLHFDDLARAEAAMFEVDRSLTLAPDMTAREGEWALVTLSIGSKSTAAVAVLHFVRGHWAAQFEPRDWARIQAFAIRSQAPPSSRAPRMERARDVHMPSAFPITGQGLGAQFLQVLHVCLSDASPSSDEASLSSSLSGHGMVVEVASDRERAIERTSSRTYDVLLVTMSRGTPELALLRELYGNGASNKPAIVCLAPGAESIDLVRLFEAGADECVARETSASELAARITSLVLRRKAHRTGAA